MEAGRSAMTENLFHVMLERLIEEQNILAERLREGLCSAAMLARIRSGERIPAKLMRDRLMARLGVSNERNEHLLNPEEYAQWEKRRSIVKCVWRKETKRAEALLKEYTREKDFTSPIGQQFHHAMEIQLMEYRNEDAEKISRRLNQALKLTVPNIDEKSIDELLLAPEEMELILKYEKYAKPQQLAQRCGELLEYIGRSAMDDRTKVMIYPRVVYYLWQVGRQEEDIDYPYLIRCLNSGIELLRNVQRTYCLWELLCAREEALERWTGQLRAEQKEKMADALGGMIRENRKWKEMLRGLSERFGVSVITDHSCYLYLQQDVCCINEIIRRRRRVLGLTRKQLTEGICEEKALVRLENEDRKTHMTIVRELLERMNLSGELWQTDIVTEDRKVLELLELLVRYANTFQTEKEKEILQQLERYLDMTVPLNKQFIKKHQAIIQWSEDREDRDRALAIAREALESTIDFEVIRKNDTLYLTYREIQCLYNMGIYAGKDKMSIYLDIVWKICREYEDNDEIEENIGIYELVMTLVADVLGNMGLYEESDALAKKVVIWSLKCGRLYEVSRNLSCLSWNNLQRQKKGIPIKERFDRKSDLETCLVISEFGKDSYHMESVKKRLADLEKTVSA